MVSPTFTKLKWITNIILQVNVNLSTASVGLSLLCVYLGT